MVNYIRAYVIYRVLFCNRVELVKKSPKSSRWCVDLLDVKPGLQPQAQTSKQNTKNILSAIFSQQISGKNYESK